MTRERADNSTLIKVMTWCQAARHYLSQCWPKFVSSYGVTRQASESELRALVRCEGYVRNWYIRQGYWLVACLALSLGNDQCWCIVNGTLVWIAVKVYSAYFLSRKCSQNIVDHFGQVLVMACAWIKVCAWPINKQLIERKCLTFQTSLLNVQMTTTIQRCLLGGIASNFKGQSVFCLIVCLTHWPLGDVAVLLKV